MAVQIHLCGTELAWLSPLSPQELGHTLGAMLRAVAVAEADVELCLVRDAEMAALNLDFMDCSGPTNILSFPSPAASTECCNPKQPVQESGCRHLGLAGSLVLSLDTLHREAWLYRQRVDAHCLFLLAHGLGHLAGFDHGPEMEMFCSNMLNGLKN